MTTGVPAQPPQRSLGSRYAATLVANILRAALGFVSGLVVARGLGAEDYGRLSFLLGGFTAVSSLFDAGSSSAFFTLLSARRSRPQLFLAYGLWLCCQFVVVAAAVLVILPASAIQSIWFSGDRTTIALAWSATFFSTQLWTAASQMGEAVRRTLRVQLAGSVQAVVHLAVLLVATSFGILSIALVFGLLIVEFAVLIAVLAPALYRQNLQASAGRDETVGSLWREFVAYCKPLIWYGWFGFMTSFADRWLLERYGGSVQQGYFGAAQQFSAVSLLATAAILRVLWKELTEAQASGALHLSAALYMRATRTLFCVGAWISFLVIPHSEFVIGMTLGPGYADAFWPFVIMLLYPIHQSLGQIQATFFYATGRTSSYARIGMLVTAVNLPMTYLALAPPSRLGLGLGAVGLAIKLVGVQLVSVALQAAAIKKAVGWSPSGAQQAAVIALFALVGYGSKGLVDATLAPAMSSALATVAVAGVLYAIGTTMVVRQWPMLAGLEPAWVAAPGATLRRMLAAR